MSGPSKRLHEDSSHSAQSKRPLEDIGMYANLSGKFTQPGTGDFHHPFEHSQDGRFPKVHRIESRDDKRPSLPHRLPLASTSSIDHPISSDSRIEVKGIKDARDNKIDDPSKSENWSSHNEVNKESDEHGNLADRKLHLYYKGDNIFEKDYQLSPGSYMSWKDNKEKQRGKRYLEADGAGAESWRSGISASQGADEAKLPPALDERNIKDTHDTSAENKNNLKGEEKFREKDRKRKDEKHREFGEREKDRTDRRTGMQPGNTINERRELQRDDRDMDKWDRERKDPQKDKDMTEKEKEPIKKDLVMTTDKEPPPTERVTTDDLTKIPEHESSGTESRILKDDTWRSDRDMKDKKRERDGELNENQRNRSGDKDTDDLFMEGDSEKDKEGFGSVMQRRRMLRSRGTQQAPQRARPKRENEGSQGKNDISAIVYKAGECMQELIKSWKEFEALHDSKNAESLQDGPTLEIRVPAEYVTSTNRQVKGAQLWGTDIYTNDSDLVAVLMHTGYCSPTSSPPPTAIQELRATVRVLPPQDCYSSTLRNNVRSRAWGAGIGCSFRIERCCIVKKGGGVIDLEPRLSHTSAVEPTLAPVSAERTMTTRAAASNARFVREVTVQYNLCNEPWLKYCISIVADKGLKKSLYTSARLKKGEVIYLETHFSRYELCYSGEKAACNGANQAAEPDQEKNQLNSNHSQNGDRNLVDQESCDVFRWSRCKKPMTESNMRNSGIPLPVEYVEVLAENLEWEDIQWSQTGVWVNGKEYPLARVHFLSSH